MPTVILSCDGTIDYRVRLVNIELLTTHHSDIVWPVCSYTFIFLNCVKQVRLCWRRVNGCTNSDESGKSFVFVSWVSLAWYSKILNLI